MLPYTEAVIQELHRVGSITPFAIYHAPTEDTTIGGKSEFMTNFKGIFIYGSRIQKISNVAKCTILTS